MSAVTDTTENKIEPSGLTQRAALLMAANVVATVLSFALPLMLVRTMSQWDYGLYKQAFQIMASAMGLLNLQVAVSVFYFTARVPEKKLQVVLNVVIFYSLVGSLVFLTFLFWPGWVTLIFHSDDLVTHVPLLGFVILLWLVSTNLEAVPIAAGDVRIASVLIVAAQLTKAILMIAAALIFGTIEAILTAAAIQGILQMSYMVIYIKRRYGQFLAPLDWPLFKAQIGNALPFGIGGITAIVQNDMHNYFVSYHFPPATFAVYAIGCFQLPLLNMLASSFAAVLNPELARHKEDNDNRAIIALWMDVTRKLSFFFIPTFAIMFIMRREFITTLFTAEYVASVPIFAINLFSVLLGIAVHLHILRLFDQLKFFRLKLYLILIPVTLGALYLGLRIGGLIGVAVATIFIQTLDVGATLIAIKRELGMSRRDLWSLTPVLRIGAAATLAGSATMGTKLMLQSVPAPATLMICAVVFGFVYLPSAFALGAIGEEEKAGLRNIWAKINRSGSVFGKVSSATEG